MNTRLIASAGCALLLASVSRAAETSAPASSTVSEPTPAPAPAAAPASPAPAVVAAPVKVSGLIQFWGVVPQRHSGAYTARLRRTALRAEGEPSPGVTTNLMLDPAQVREDDLKTATVVKTYSGKTGATTTVDAVTDTGRKSPLQDAIIGFNKPFARCPVVKRIQAGQFKFPFGREGLLPDPEVETVERSLVSTVLKWSDARDIGVQTQAGYGPLDVWGGAFNGEGQNRWDVNNHVNGNVRAVVKLAEGCSVGASYQGGRKGKAEDLNEHTGAEVAAAGKPMGVPVRFAAEYAFGASGPVGKAAFARTGYGVLAVGVWPGTIDLVAKFDWLDPTIDRGRDWQAETTAGLSVSLNPKMKFQWNYVFADEAAKIHNDLIRMNLQTTF